MRLLISLLFLLVLVGATMLAPVALAKPVAEYLPAANQYDSSVPLPKSVLGWELGDWHVRHDQLVAYHEALASASNRVSIEEIGRTHEQRPLKLLTITHPDNFARLDQIRQAHIDGAADAPLVLWFGYSVHGNESSGANAGLLFAYHLAGLQAPAFDEALRNTVILIEPSINPDGLSRFAQWANMHKSTSALVADRANREHQEVWPGGRFNHYWFDLNRDWLLLTHPESEARIAQFQKWRPHVLTDFHEMGSDNTYFFQPGVPERKHPLTPEQNVELTAKLAAFHAKALDAAGRLYYSEESFDDFYYGKGSTYPDVQGAIGILFEQASSRGHLMATDNGHLSFAQGIQNQLATSLSTLEGALSIGDQLKAHRRDFFRDAGREANADRTRAWVFGDATDVTRGRRLAQIFRAHDIDVFELAKRIRAGDATFEPGSSWVIPTNQRQYRLIKAMFESRTEFQDSTFYDVSAWTLPLAFNLPYAAQTSAADLLGDALVGETAEVAVPGPAYAYALRWSDYDSPRVLADLLSNEVRVRVATKPLVAVTRQGPQRFERGTVIIASNIHQVKDLPSILQASGGGFVELTTGLTPDGVDLGSPSVEALEPVKPLIVVGPGVNATEVGEIWHLLDTRIGLPLVMVDKHRLKSTDLNDYTHVVMADGSYSDVNQEWVERLKDWIKAGGVLVSARRGAAWATEQELHKAGSADESDDKSDQADDNEAIERKPYADHADDFSKTVIGGTIVNGMLDVTHPIGYGYSREQVPLLHRGTTFLELSDNPYETVIQYADEPLLAGFLGDERKTQMAGSAALIASRSGKGAVIRFTFNPNFRGVWYGTNKLFLNALFFGQLIDNTPVPDTDKRL